MRASLLSKSLIEQSPPFRSDCDIPPQIQSKIKTSLNDCNLESETCSLFAETVYKSLEKTRYFNFMLCFLWPCDLRPVVRCDVGLCGTLTFVHRVNSVKTWDILREDTVFSC